MKTRHSLLLSNTYSTPTSFSAFDFSQSGEVSQEYMGNKKLLEAIEIEPNETRILRDLHELAGLFPNRPSLLAGPIRHLKVEPHYREPTSRLWLSPQTYRKTSKIRLTGNWIEKAGFTCHERIRVIPMHRMLIIVPEVVTQTDTNEHE